MQITLTMWQMKRSVSSQKPGVCRVSQTERFSSELQCLSFNFQPTVTVSQRGSWKSWKKKGAVMHRSGVTMWDPRSWVLPARVCGLTLKPSVPALWGADLVLLWCCKTPFVPSTDLRPNVGLSSPKSVGGGKKDDCLEVDLALFLQYLGNNVTVYQFRAQVELKNFFLLFF